ncbi:MAG: extracellular solute-binding protein [Alphaproteobacteria bacterium]|nr:extracellular solute-binding protein [Alphaproteobacteria bacterium]
MRLRDILTTGFAALFALAGTALAQPAPTSITPDLIAAAKKEGKVVYYTAVDVKVAEQIAKAFEEKYPGIKVQVERSGAERVFQRIGQEYSSKIYNVDTVNSSDAAHFVHWKREGWLAPVVPEDVAKHYAPAYKDPDGMHAAWRITLAPIAYNTKLVTAAEAPKSYADLLDPKWSGKIVKAHPGYSGTILTQTFQVSRDIGWGYFEKLAGQRVMQVQSATDPPNKVVSGERPIMSDGTEYNVLLLKQTGAPIEVVYPAEGTPLVVGPSAVMKNAPNPNAARLFHIWSFTVEAQQKMVDIGALRSAHPGVKEPAGRKPLSEIKLMKDDPAEVDKQSEELKARYTRNFKT